MKTTERFMRNTVRVLLIIMIIVSCTAISYAATLSDVAPLLEKLESAYNRNDLMGIADCYAYDFSLSYKIAEKVTGVDSSILESLMPFMNGFMSLQAEQSGTRPTCKLTPVSYRGDDYAGLLKYNVLFTYADGTTNQYDTEMDIKKYNSEWRIDIFQRTEMNKLMFNRGDEEDSFVYPDITEDDFKKKIIMVDIPQKYRYATTKLMRFINEDGKILFQDYYEDYKEDCDGFIPVKSNGKWGFVNHYGQKMTEFCFWSIDYAGDGYWKVWDEKGLGLINLKTGEGFECIYDRLGNVYKGYIPAKKGDLWGILDVNGNVVSGFKYTEISESPSYGLLIAYINKATGLIDYQGNVLIKPTVDMEITDRINENFIRIWKDGARYISDNKGNAIYQWNGEIEVIDSENIYLRGDGYTGTKGINIFLNSNGKKTEIKSVLQEQDSSINRFYIYPKTYDGEWMEIQYGHVTENTILNDKKEDIFSYNYINTKGQLKYKEKMPIYKNTYVFSAAENKHVYVYDNQLCVVDCNNNTFSKYPVSGKLPSASIVSMKGLFGQDKMVFKGDNPSAAILDLKEMIAYQFYDMTTYPGPFGLSYDDDYEAESVTVTDGAYYGLITKKGLVGKGMDYISVSNWGKYGSLSEGDEPTDINIGTDGSVYTVKDNKNVEIKTVPLEKSGLKAVKMKGTTTELTLRTKGKAEKKETVKKETAAPANETEQVMPVPETAAEQPTSVPAAAAEQITPEPAAAEEQSTPVAEKNEPEGKAENQQSDSGSEKQADADTWTCDKCGQTGNTGNFCPHCGNKAPEPSITMTITTFSGTARLVKSKINLRAQPLQTARILNVLTDTKADLDVIGLSVDAEETEWYQVILPDKSMGFIRGDLLTFINGGKESASPEKKDSSKKEYKTVTLVDNVVVRMEPTKDSKRVTTIADANTSVKVLDTVYDNDGTRWCYVKAKGKYGFIQEDLLK